MRHPLSHASKPIEAEAAGAREEWPAHEAPPPPPMPEELPPEFGIARPARLLGIAWAVSVPAVLWGHVKFSNPFAALTVGAGVLVGLGIAAALAWVAFHTMKRSRNAAAGVFGGLACAGLMCNVLVGVFMSLASGALREIDHGPGTVRSQIRQELAIAKQVAKEEIAKAHEEGVQGLLKDAPAPVAPDLVLAPVGDKEATPAVPARPAAELAANAPAEVQPPAAPAPAAVKPAASRPKVVVAKAAPKPQVNVPARGISVRKAGTRLPEPVVATIDDATVDRVAMDAAMAVQDRVDRAARQFAESSVRLSAMRDPLLYHSAPEFRDFRRAMDLHRTDAEALREAVATAAAQMRTRLSQAGVPTPQIERHVTMAFPREITEASAEFHEAYLCWLDAREHRATILENSIGRWKYNPESKQLWLADDGVRSACETAFDSVRATNSILAVKREQAEGMGIPTRAAEMQSQSGRVAGEDVGG